MKFILSSPFTRKIWFKEISTKFAYVIGVAFDYFLKQLILDQLFGYEGREYWMELEGAGDLEQLAETDAGGNDGEVGDGDDDIGDDLHYLN